MRKLENLHGKSGLQLVFGLVIGIAFGFLLQKGGVTYYHLIINQLLLRNFIVFKVIFSAIITGMIGVYALRELGLVELHPKSAHVTSVVGGGLIFGVGFALLGYCPGTSAGAIGMGSVHAAFGVIGIILGAGVYANYYPKIKEKYFKWDIGNKTIPEALNVNPWIVIIPLTIALTILLYLVESMGY